MSLFRFCACVIAALFLQSCVGVSGMPGAVSKAEAITIADEYVSKNFADFDRRQRTEVVSDGGANWVVTYTQQPAPAGMSIIGGGIPTIVIDKKTGKVLRATRDQ